MKSINLVGIDVSAKELVLVMETHNGKKHDAVFENTHAGHKKLLKYITKRGGSAKVSLEATGVYHLELALFLSNSDKVAVMVVNPRAIKNFSQAINQRAKTDKVDAYCILEYLKRIDFQEWIPPSSEILALRALCRRAHQLKNEMVREKNRQHSNEFNIGLDGIVENDIAVNLRHLQKRIDLLQAKMLELVKQSAELAEKYELLVSVTGIAKVSAMQLLSELMCLPPDMQAAQWVAHAGLDPRARESGSSICKPRHISKVGNKYLRTALYMPAWVAAQRDPHVKGFYQKLISAGKKPMQAIVAVMRKMLLAIWGMFNAKQKWCGTKFYSLNLTENTVDI